jgi:hypothetical protein
MRLPFAQRPHRCATLRWLPFDERGDGSTPALGNNHPYQNEDKNKNLFPAKVFTGEWPRCSPSIICGFAKRETRIEVHARRPALIAMWLPAAAAAHTFQTSERMRDPHQSKPPEQASSAQS